MSNSPSSRGEMLEGVATDNPKGTAAGITFFGQFIDHDLTLDNEPQPTDTVDVEGLVNGRTFAFDLDSVYGGGPKKSPQLYDGDKFLIGTATDGVTPDLPRNANGTAILVEPRNDENLIIAQIHLSFLRLHNSLVDQGMSFDEARQTVVGAYRYVVLNDYLPQIVGQEAVNKALRRACQGRVLPAGVEGRPDDPGGVLDGGIPLRPLPSSERLRHQRYVGRRAGVLARPHRGRPARRPPPPSRSTRSRHRSEQAELGYRLQQLLQRASASQRPRILR